MNNNKETSNYIFFFLMGILFTLSIIAIVMQNKPLIEIDNNKNYIIPTGEEINIFCKENDYKYGWISATCNQNEVQCYKELTNGWKRFDCLPFKK